MDGEIDFTKYSEAELLELWGRIDPRYAPINCALVGSGTLAADGIHVHLSGRRAGLFGSVFKRNVELTWKGISDVEWNGNIVLFTYRAHLATEGAITLWFSDQAAAQRFAAVLPKERTAEFHPQLQARVEFDQNLILQSRYAPVTVGLVAINTLVFLVMVFAGAEWIVPRGNVVAVTNVAVYPFRRHPSSL
jgi:hypothetical protein